MVPKFVYGSIAPVFTVFEEDGAFDEAGQRRFLDFLVERGGISAYFVRSGLGQMYTYSYEDARAMARTACSQLAGNGPVICGASGVWNRDYGNRPDPDTFIRQSLELSRFAEGAGAAGVVHTMPEALLPDGPESHADLILRYFDMVCSAVTCPVFIYQPPGTAQEYCVTMDLLGRLADIPNLVAIKVSTSDAKYVHDLVSAVRGKDFAMISGAETAFLAGVASGTKAVIGQGATINPQILNAIQSRFEAGDIDGAREAQRVTNMLCDRTSNCVEFFKRYACERGYTVPVHGRPAGSPYLKDAQPLGKGEYETYRRLLEETLAPYL